MFPAQNIERAVLKGEFQLLLLLSNPSFIKSFQLDLMHHNLLHITSRKVGLDTASYKWFNLKLI